MAANLPPEIGKVLEGLFKKGAQSESGDWIAEYVDFMMIADYSLL